MREVACDFGTSNTVLAAFNESTERAETMEVPGITTLMRYRPTGGASESTAWGTPSLIHFGEKETLIGNQVLSRGLADHPDTFRWMKRGIAYGGKKKRTSQGFKSPQEAGREFLTRLLQYAPDRISLESDAFTFTAPVEAFENFQDWLWQISEHVGIGRLRLLDEPTASIFGYHGAARRDERFLIIDFGGGTLDASMVRVDLDSSDGRKAIQLGQAGVDLGGMDIDSWLLEDFSKRHHIGDSDRRDLEGLILRQAEEVKITLSNPDEPEAELKILIDRASGPRLLLTTYAKSCAGCREGRAVNHDEAGSACLGCILIDRKFPDRINETIDRALENAAIKAGVRRSDITKVLVTGGTSLVPMFRRIIEDRFRGKVEYDQPFDCVVRGACRGVVVPILQHDYAIKSYNKEKRAYEFNPLFKKGTEYPTAPGAVRKWCRGTVDGATRIGLDIYEVSQLRHRDLSASMVDAQGVIRDARISTEFHYVWLNPAEDSRTFIPADPPYNSQRDSRRFLCSFRIDGNRRLLVTAADNLTGKTLMEDHPVVRL